MATIVAKNAVKRKPGYLYFVDGNGNVKETKMNRKGGKKGRKVCSVSKAAKKRKPAKKKAATRKTTTARKTTRRKATTKRKTTKKR